MDRRQKRGEKKDGKAGKFVFRPNFLILSRGEKDPVSKKSLIKSDTEEEGGFCLKKGEWVGVGFPRVCAFQCSFMLLVLSASRL